MDAGHGGNFGGDGGGEPLSDVGVGLLGHLGGGGFSSADGPHGLVSNDDAVPVRDGGKESVELSLEDVVGRSGLTVLEGLSDADNGVEASILSLLDLLGDAIVGLVEKLSTLGVSNNAPSEFEVLDLVSGDLSGVRAHLVGGDVLGSNFDLRLQHGFGGGNVDREREHNNVNGVLVPLHRVESVLYELSHEVNGSVGFPVATDNVFSLGSCLFDHLI